MGRAGFLQHEDCAQGIDASLKRLDLAMKIMEGEELFQEL